MRPLVVLDVVGLTPAMLGPATPRINAIRDRGFAAPLETVFPAVTCPVQATMLTGLPPSEHGIVGNGWYFRDLAEVLFWRQSRSLVTGEEIFERARRVHPGSTSAKLFLWFNMYGRADFAVTPRPAYPADGRKIPDIWTEPPELRDDLVDRLGPFPLFHFWGPHACIVSSRWIAECAALVIAEHRPTLTMVYLPHLDYDLQRFGPDDPRISAEVAAVDALVGTLDDAARAAGASTLVLSEYGITAVSRPVFLNRVLREAGLLRIHRNAAGENLDAGSSDAFAVADHQVAHVYVRDPARIAEVRRTLEAVPGVAEILDAAGRAEAGIDHPRSGDLVAVADADSWFAYPFWLDDRQAPDYARTVDIHRKPGYDPAELFIDPELRFPRARIAWTLLRRRLGQRALLDVIPLDPSVVRGSHGRLPARDDDGPVLISSCAALRRPRFRMAGIPDLILAHLASD